jgi:DNA-binding CsgD family transcriptional regulator
VEHAQSGQLDAAASGSRAEETTRLLLASGYGLLIAWTLLFYHSLLLFGLDASPIYGMQLSRFVSLLGALAVLVVARVSRSPRFVSRPVVAGAAGMLAVGSLLVASGPLLGQWALLPGQVVGSALTGLGLAPMLLAWGRLFSPMGTRFAAGATGFATVGAGALYFVVVGIPVPVLGVAVAALLPLASLWVFLAAEPDALLAEHPVTTVVTPHVFRWKFAVAITFYGVLFGVMGYVLPFKSVVGYAFTNTLSVLLGTVAVALVTVWVMLLLKRTDPSAAYWPVIPLIAVGFVLLPFLGLEHAGVATAVAYAGFACFTVFLWVAMCDMARTTGHSVVTVFSGGILFSKLGVFVGTIVMYTAARTMQLEFAQLTAISFACVSGLGSVAALVMDGGQFAYGRAETAADGVSAPHVATDQVCERCAEIAKEHGLSAREAEVFELLAKGRNSPFIQHELYIAKSTVETHIKHIYRKVGVNDRQELLDLVQRAKK